MFPAGATSNADLTLPPSLLLPTNSLTPSHYIRSRLLPNFSTNSPSRSATRPCTTPPSLPLTPTSNSVSIPWAAPYRSLPHNRRIMRFSRRAQGAKSRSPQPPPTLARCPLTPRIPKQPLPACFLLNRSTNPSSKAVLGPASQWGDRAQRRSRRRTQTKPQNRSASGRSWRSR